MLSMQDMLVRALRQWVGYTRQRLKQQGEEHWKIINAIRSNDLQSSVDAARKHGLGSGVDIALNFNKKVDIDKKRAEIAKLNFRSLNNIRPGGAAR